MIIDFHTHLFPKDVRNNLAKYGKKDSLFRLIFALKWPNMLGGSKQLKMIGAKELVKSMDQAGIDKSVICGFSWFDQGLCRACNDYMLDSIKKYPDRLLGFVSVTLNDSDKTVYEIERCVRLGAKGVGEIAAEPQGFSITDKKIIGPVAEAAKKFNIPVMLHSNETVGHYYVGKAKSDVKKYYDFILLYPDIDIILAHWGGGLFFYELMPEVEKALKRVYYDTAISIFLYNPKIYSVATEIIGGDKILFGTDYPLVDQKKCMEQIENIGISKEYKNKMFAGNALKLLGL